MSNFTFVKDATTWWPVTWNEPVDGGGVSQCSLELRFRRKPWDTVAATYEQDNLAFLQDVARDWRGIVDDAGRPLPFDLAMQTAMTARPAFSEAMGGAYMAFLRAMPETRLGNSAASLAGGPAAGQAPAAAGVPRATPASGRRSKKPG